MRRLILLGASLALASVAVAFVLAPGRAAGPSPTLAPSATRPLTLKGVHFAPRERVRVMLEVNGATYSLRVRAGARGGFRARFSTGIAFDPCNDVLRARALGAGGSRAALKLPQRECPVAL